MREGRRESVLPCSMFLVGAWSAPEEESALCCCATKRTRVVSSGLAPQSVRRAESLSFWPYHFILRLNERRMEGRGHHMWSLTGEVPEAGSRVYGVQAGAAQAGAVCTLRASRRT